MTIEEIQAQGEWARAFGKAKRENPYFAIDELPETEEELKEWEKKVSAWDLGWELEDAYRNALKYRE